MTWLRTVVALVLSITGVSATAPAVRTSLPPPPPPVTAPAGSNCPEWYEPAMDAGWPEDTWPTLDHIMWRESKCRPDATHHNANGSTDRGLLQVNSVHLPWLADRGVSAADLYDGPTNLVAGLWLYEASGWAPWRT